MGGRIYDPELGRMLQADPFIQAPDNTQNYDRYTYVYNNPINYSDPSGYFSWNRFRDNVVRPVASIAIAFYMPNYLVGSWQFSSTQALVATGFTTGAIGSGTLKGAAIGALGGYVSSKINGLGVTAGMSTEASSRLAARQVFYHGLKSGIVSHLQGGQFGHGFVSGFLSASTSGLVESLDLDGLAEVAANAVVGGSVSKLSGGKFANGAVTAAFSRTLEGLSGSSDEKHRRESGLDVNRELTPDELARAKENYHKIIALAVEAQESGKLDPMKIGSGTVNDVSVSDVKFRDEYIDEYGFYAAGSHIFFDREYGYVTKEIFVTGHGCYTLVECAISVGHELGHTTERNLKIERDSSNEANAEEQGRWFRNVILP